MRFSIVAATGVASAVVAAIVAAPMPPAMRATLWSATMLASLVGWGTLVNLWLAPKQLVDWGLRAGWGLALFLMTGGFLCLGHLATRATFIVHVWLGVVALLGLAVLRRSPSCLWTSLRLRSAIEIVQARSFALVAAAYAMAALTFLAFLGNHSFQPSDDPPLYFMLAEKLVQVGSMFEPFAGRRVTVLGGQVYLHASFISVASIYYLHVVDAGISLFIVLGLLIGHARQVCPQRWLAAALGLALLLLFTLHDVRINTTSHTSGLAALLALFRTARIPFEAGSERPMWPIEPRRAVALGGLALASVLLRVSNGTTAVLFVAFVMASDFVLGARRPWSGDSVLSLLRPASLSAGTFVAGLLPWSVLEHESTGTFLYPLGHSNLTPGWTLGLEAAKSLKQEATELVVNIFQGRPIELFVPFVIAGLIPTACRHRNDTMAFSLASLIGFAAFSHNAVAFGHHHVVRYCSAFVTAAALLVILSLDRKGTRGALVAFGVGTHLILSMGDTQTMLEGYVRSAYRAFHGADQEFNALTQDYVDVQSHVPGGATMATAVFEGFRFDFKRNRIFALDVLGGAGPRPGWPAMKGPQALCEYLLANGIQYLVWVDFNLPSEFYNRAHWTSHLRKNGSYLQGQAVFQLDAEDSIEKLSAMRHVVYQAYGMTVLDLATPK
jgi:hypothetical protein